MNNYPAPSADALSLSAFRHVVSLCDRYEDAWRSGEDPRIEDTWTPRRARGARSCSAS
jgi:hypothetical protein